jgi:uncharacterized protein
VAIGWYRKAAERGHADAQYNLGLMYYDGQGTPLDPSEASRWFRKAAEQGLADAQFNLGLLYAHSRGVEKDYVEASLWLILAAQGASPVNKEQFSNERGNIASRMFPQQLGEAQRRAREWKPSRGEKKDEKQK